MNATPYIGNKYLRQLQLVGFLLLLVAVFVGAFVIADLGSLAGYLVVLVACVAPMTMWMRRGAGTLPILPIAALIYFLYYGMAIIGGNTDHYTQDEILAAALTVALFLAMATLAWASLAFRPHPEPLEIDRELHLDFAVPRLVFGALSLGFVFEIVGQDNWQLVLGPAMGTFRSVTMSTAAVGCFLFGTALGRRTLSGYEKFLSYLLLASLVILDIRGLIMHTSILLIAAVIIGFIISSKQIPWITLTIFMVLTALLHTSEFVERDRYWTAEGDRQTIGVMEVPALLTDWLSAGIDQIGKVNDQDRVSLLSRASQLTNLLLVQEQTPRNIRFLDGATYANFPRMLIPRFLSPDKITSQENLNLLSVRYGLQGVEDTNATTIAWNLVPEAYANFGYFGVVVAGLAFGLMIGSLTWFTSGAPPISLRGLVGLAALVTLLDVEYDFSYLLLNLLQALFSISMFFIGIKALDMLLGAKVLEKQPAPFRPARPAGRTAR